MAQPAHYRSRAPLYGELVGAGIADRVRAFLRASVRGFPDGGGAGKERGADVPRRSRHGRRHRRGARIGRKSKLGASRRPGRARKSGGKMKTIACSLLLVMTLGAQQPPPPGGGPGRGQGRGGGRGGSPVGPLEESGFRQIFDGKSLAGWDCDADFWRVEG